MPEDKHFFIFSALSSTNNGRKSVTALRQLPRQPRQTNTKAKIRNLTIQQLTNNKQHENYKSTTITCSTGLEHKDYEQNYILDKW